MGGRLFGGIIFVGTVLTGAGVGVCLRLRLRLHLRRHLLLCRLAFQLAAQLPLSAASPALMLPPAALLLSPAPLHEAANSAAWLAGKLA